MRETTILIFSGYNQRAIIAFLRTLCQNNVKNYAIVALSTEDDILHTIYKEKVKAVRASRELNVQVFEKIIDQIREHDSEEFFIVPSSEYFNRFLLKERRTIEALGCKVPLVEEPLYTLISDKNSFNQLCCLNGISVPSRIEFPNYFSEAFVAKPINYFSVSGEVFAPILVRNNKEYEKFKTNYPLQSFFYEKFIEGRNFYLLYYFDKDGKLFDFSQENLVQQPYGKSMVAAKTAKVHKKEIGKQMADIFKKLRFRGLVMVELRQTDEDYFLIEANPRLWGPSQLFVDAKCNFFECFLVDNKLLQKEIIFEERMCLYFWNGGVQQTWKDKGQLKFFADGEEELFEHYPEWVEADVYRREDTKWIFLQGR